MATGVYKKSKKHRENLSKALKEYWSDETRHDDWTEKIQEGIEEYWADKPQEEYVLGKRYRQKFHGERDKICYRIFQREYQRKFRESHPRLLCVFEAKERTERQINHTKNGTNYTNHTNELTRRNKMNSEKYEKLQNDFFEKLQHTHTPGEIKLLISWFKEEKKKLESEKEETDEG